MPPLRSEPTGGDPSAKAQPLELAPIEAFGGERALDRRPAQHALGVATPVDKPAKIETLPPRPSPKRQRVGIGCAEIGRAHV